MRVSQDTHKYACGSLSNPHAHPYIESLSPPGPRRARAQADTNHDGKIEYSEFLHVMAPALLGHEHDEDVSMKRRMKLSGLC